MQNPVTTFTDKVTRMIRSMVWLALCGAGRAGGTVGEISAFLSSSTPGGAELCHQGVVERALRELQSDGRVTRSGAQWCPVVES